MVAKATNCDHKVFLKNYEQMCVITYIRVLFNLELVSWKRVESMLKKICSQDLLVSSVLSIAINSPGRIISVANVEMNCDNLNENKFVSSFISQLILIISSTSCLL